MSTQAPQPSPGVQYVLQRVAELEFAMMVEKESGAAKDTTIAQQAARIAELEKAAEKPRQDDPI